MAGKTDKPDRVFTLIPGKDAVDSLEDPNGSQALYEQMCAALGIEPKPPKESDPEKEERHPCPVERAKGTAKQYSEL